MKILSNNILEELLTVNTVTCLSLYMPTHQSHPENQQDPIVFKHLLKQLEVSLLKQFSESETKEHLHPLELLTKDKVFWNHTTPGIAIFSAPGVFKAIGLQQSFKELAVVANSLYTKPLRQYLQTTDRYQVLGLSLDRIQLFEGNRHSLVEIPLAVDMPKTIIEVLGKDVTEKQTTVASYGGVGSGSVSMHHGDGGIKDQVDNDTEKFFRFISKEIFENYSKPTELPLILAALPEHHNLFHKVSNNPFLLEEGIPKNPESLSNNDLVKMAWEVMEPVYLLKVKNLAEEFEQAKATNKGSEDMEAIISAMEEGRVATILIESGKIIPGKAIASYSVGFGNGAIDNLETDDLLDDLADLAKKMGADALIIPKEDMPSKTGLAAIFRY
jgi:hypothetical protein